MCVRACACVCVCVCVLSLYFITSHSLWRVGRSTVSRSQSPQTTSPSTVSQTSPSVSLPHAMCAHPPSPPPSLPPSPPPSLPPSPDDDNRISLQPIPGHSDHHNDYVNACYIDVCDFQQTYGQLVVMGGCLIPSTSCRPLATVMFILQGYNLPRKFIATQGMCPPCVNYVCVLSTVW